MLGEGEEVLEGEGEGVGEEWAGEGDGVCGGGDVRKRAVVAVVGDGGGGEEGLYEGGRGGFAVEGGFDGVLELEGGEVLEVMSWLECVEMHTNMFPAGCR